MPYLNVDLNFSDHPKFIKFENILGRGSSILVIRLWAYVGKHFAETGEILLDDRSIENKIDWWGESGLAVKALLDTRLLEKTKSGYRVHDWGEHEGHIWPLYLRGKNNVKKRWEKLANKNRKNTNRHTNQNTNRRTKCDTNKTTNGHTNGDAPFKVRKGKVRLGRATEGKTVLTTDSVIIDGVVS